MVILGILAFVLIALLPVGIIVLIVSAAVNKEKGNNTTKFANGVRTVYTYIIVIATLFMIIAGTIVAVPSILDYFLPESELEVPYYSQDKQEHELEIRNERYEGLTNFVTSLAIVVIATPIFLSYSAEAKKLRIEKIENKEKEIKEAKTTTGAKKTTRTKTVKKEK